MPGPDCDEIAHGAADSSALPIFDSPWSAWDGHGMSSTPTRNIALTTVPENYIRAQVASGRHPNASKVVRTGLRPLMEHDRGSPRSKAVVEDRPSR